MDKIWKTLIETLSLSQWPELEKNLQLLCLHTFTMTGATITTNKTILFTIWIFILGQKSSLKGGSRPVQLQSVFGIRGRKTSFKCLPLSDRDDRHFIVVDDYIWIFQWKWIGAQLTTSRRITFCVGTSMRKPITQYLLIFDVQRKCPGFLNSPSTSRREIKSCPGESLNYVYLFFCLQIFWLFHAVKFDNII